MSVEIFCLYVNTRLMYTQNQNQKKKLIVLSMHKWLFVGQLDNVNPNFLYLSVTFGGHQNEFVAWLTSKPFLLYQIIVYEYMGV